MSDEPAAGPLRRRLRETRRIWSRPAQGEPPPELPAAQIDEPKAGAVLERGFVHLAGWALTPGGPVNRIDVTVDGVPLARARLCVTRRDLPDTFVMPETKLGGFQCVLDLTGLPAEATEVTIGGHVTGRDGETFDLPARTWNLARRDEVIDPDPERSALLRERAAAGAAARPPAKPEGSGAEGPKVLAITHNIALGGGQLVMLELLRRFADEHGMTGAVVAPKDGATRGDLEAAGYAVHIGGEYPVRDIETYEARMAELVAWAAPQDFDLVLVNTMLAFPGGDLAGRLGLPAVWIVHESYGLEGYWATFEKGGLHPYVRERGAESFRSAAGIIFEVDATRELFRGSAGNAPLATLPYGIDIAAHDREIAGLDRDEVREELGYAPDEFVVLCLGTLEPRKGQIQLVEAFSRISSAHPEARLVLVGALDNGYDREVRDAVDLLGVDGRVDVHPVTPGIAEHYIASDLLVCASDIESLPRTVLEAMAFRLPVMATDVFGLPEVIEDGTTGWIVESRDTAALAAGLERALAAGPGERLRIAGAARELVEAEHDSPRCAARYAETLRAAIGR